MVYHVVLDSELYYVVLNCDVLKSVLSVAIIVIRESIGHFTCYIRHPKYIMLFIVAYRYLPADSGEDYPKLHRLVAAAVLGW